MAKDGTHLFILTFELLKFMNNCKDEIIKGNMVKYSIELMNVLSNSM